MNTQLTLHKAFRVIVKAYHTQIVPKHTRIFDTLSKAEEYKDILEREVVWNTAVSLEIQEVYCVRESVLDENATPTYQYHLLNGDLVKFEE